MPFPLVPVLGAALGLGSIWSESNNAAAMAQVSRENTDKAIAANKEMAQYAYQKDLEMWNRSNMYNSPSAQADRLRQAGLNPMLLYGTGSAAATGNTGTTMPKYQAPNLEYKYQAATPNISGVLGSYQNIAMMQAQVDNVKANTNAINQKTANDALTNVILAAEAAQAPDVQAAHLKKLRGEAESSKVSGDYAQLMAEIGRQRGMTDLETQQVINKYLAKEKEQGLARGSVGLSRESFAFVQESKMAPYALAVKQYEAARAKAESSLAAGTLDASIARAKGESESVRLENIYKEFVNRLANRGLTVHDNALLRGMSSDFDKGGFDPDAGYEKFKRDVENLKSNWFGGSKSRGSRFATVTKHR